MRKVLITGGSGFLGRHLAVALKDTHDVVIASRNNLANQQASMITGCPARSLDVARIEAVRDVFNEVKPDVVIHAAATKYVGWSEEQPLECIDVNVVGSQNVARVALERGVGLVIGISTDKATPPARNTYGLSKSMMERMFCALDRRSGPTRFVCTRFGNIAWSSGSAFCQWQETFDASEAPVILSTGPHMRRFFFTVAEAVDLVLTAMRHSEELRGKVLTRPMKSACIRDILDVWVEINGGGWEPTPDGRPGDAVDELLVGPTELEFTETVVLDGATHYAVSMAERATVPLTTSPSSFNAVRLDRAGIVALLESRKRWH